MDPVDVLVCGQLFYDLGFPGLCGPPVPGQEIWTDQLVSGPGGIANFAIAAARLGLSVSLVTAVGDDAFGQVCVRELQELPGIDLTYAATVPGWSTPVTAALSYEPDRALVTAGTPPPLSADDLLAGAVPRASAAVAHLEPRGLNWVATAARQGTRVFADIGWDQTGRWDTCVLDQLESCFGFFPNHVEAMAYTRTETPEKAVRALADRVQVAVVTCGAGGALAIDAGSSESVACPVVPVHAVDTTAAGDIFGGALVYGYLQADWTLAQRVGFAGLCAGLAVGRPGGSVSAPRPADLRAWLGCAPPHLRGRFGFLADHLGRFR